MTREEAKKLLPIIQAYAEGKEIEFCDLHGIWSIPEELSFSSKPKNYRIKKEPKYRPFESCDELIQFWDKHYTNGNRPKGTLPLIWVKRKSIAFECFITDFNRPEGELYVHDNWRNLEDLFDDWEFLDGKPCGIEVTE